MRHGLPLLAILPALAESPSERMAPSISTAMDIWMSRPCVLRCRLKEGDRIPSDSVRAAAVRAVRNVAGRDAVFSGVCCLPDGWSSIFIGLPEAGTVPVVHNPQPQGDVKLPGEALKILRQIDKHREAAVRRGASREDDSQGYALFEDPSSHADQPRRYRILRDSLAVGWPQLSSERSQRS